MVENKICGNLEFGILEILNCENLELLKMKIGKLETLEIRNFGYFGN